MKLLFKGGTLAEGARQGADLNMWDKRLDQARIQDFFGHRYGWTMRQAEEELSPWWMAEALLELAEIRAEAEREEQEQAEREQRRRERARGPFG